MPGTPPNKTTDPDTIPPPNTLENFSARMGKRCTVVCSTSTILNQVKKAKADGMSQDYQKFWESEVQDLTDEMIKSVDAALETKQAA